MKRLLLLLLVCVSCTSTDLIQDSPMGLPLGNKTEYFKRKYGKELFPIRESYLNDSPIPLKNKSFAGIVWEEVTLTFWNGRLHSVSFSTDNIIAFSPVYGALCKKYRQYSVGQLRENIFEHTTFFDGKTRVHAFYQKENGMFCILYVDEVIRDKELNEL